ncbi:hypothetical protein PQX77_016679 [Marasmius sp. AFHP31]|nr:hypothetical protein PQX77_016679 [Marasmius sp. AFHP31]
MASSDDLQEFLEPYLTVQAVVVMPIATLSAELLLYGMYAILFGLCMHILRQRRSCLGLYSVCTILLFAFATLYVASDIYSTTQQAIIDFEAAKTQDLEPLARYLNQDGDSGRILWGIITTTLSFPLMNVLADIMLVHRCYILWGYKGFILYILGGAAFVLNGIYLASSTMIIIGLSRKSTMLDFYLRGAQIDDGNSIALAVFNSILSLLTAGRIWWISREVGRHLGEVQMRARHRTIVAAILESGLLYPATLITDMVISRVLDPDSIGVIPVDLASVVILMSGLAPTLIIVRVGYDKSVESVQQMMSTYFAEEASQRRTGLGTNAPRLIVDIRSNAQAGNLEDRTEDPKSGVNMGQSQKETV